VTQTRCERSKAQSERAIVVASAHIRFCYRPLNFAAR